LDERHVMELGCGCGSVGIYAAACGAASVLLTDSDCKLLHVAATNVRRNRQLLGRATCDMRTHCWGDRDLVLPPQLDYVGGRDLSYNRGSHDPLCHSIRWMCEERSPRVVLAHEQRHPDGLVRLHAAAAARGLEITTIWNDKDDTWAAGTASTAFHDRTRSRPNEIALLSALPRGTIALLEVSLKRAQYTQV